MRKFDIFPKLKDKEFEYRTTLGGAITVCSFLIIVAISVKYVKEINQKITKQNVFFESSSNSFSRRMFLRFNMTVSIPCNYLQVHILDDSMKHKRESLRSLMKQELDFNGNEIGEPQVFTQNLSTNRECGNCYGNGFTECCFSCLDVVYGFIGNAKILPRISTIDQCRDDFQRVKNNEKCRIIGSTVTPNSLGVLSISVDSERPIGKRQPVDLTLTGLNVNLSHEIHQFYFGTNVGLENPLDNWSIKQAVPGFRQYKYNLGLVQTKVVKEEETVDAIQYSAELSENPIEQFITTERPMISFKYDLYSLSSLIKTEKPRITQIILDLCGIVGGGFMISGLINIAVHSMKAKKQ